jgi:hypothetical protein
MSGETVLTIGTLYEMLPIKYEQYSVTYCTSTRIDTETEPQLKLRSNSVYCAIFLKQIDNWRAYTLLEILQTAMSLLPQTDLFCNYFCHSQNDATVAVTILSLTVENGTVHKSVILKTTLQWVQVILMLVDVNIDDTMLGSSLQLPHSLLDMHHMIQKRMLQHIILSPYL